MATYEVVAIDRETGGEARFRFGGVPSEQVIINWLSRRRQNIGGMSTQIPVNRWLATRHYPSKKGWMIIDLERVFAAPLRGRPHIMIWHGVKRSTRVYPSEAAALMTMSYLIAMPEQLALIL